MFGNKSYLHALLDSIIRKTIINGESRELVVKVPYFELADEYKHYDVPIEAHILDLKITITTQFSDDGDDYETGKGFAVTNKTRQ